MERHLLGGTLAIATALVWSAAVIFYKKAERVPPLAVNLLKNLVALLLLVPTAGALGGAVEGLRACSSADAAILALSGFLGIALGDTLFFWSLRLAGAGLVSIADSTYVPFIFLFSWALLGERLLPVQYAGAALIFAAVLLASGHEPPPGRTRGQIVLGIALCVLDMALMTFGIVIAKPAIERTPLAVSTGIRVASGTASLALGIALLPGRRVLFGALRPSREWRALLPASLLGYASLLLWMGGFQNTYASVAGVLNQTSSVFTILFAAWFLREPLTRRKSIALLAALAGVALVMAPGLLEEALR
ncbi:MAG: DMT family transporter [Planctomycetota bacterium]